MIAQQSFVEALSSQARSPEIPVEDDVYGWLVGSWELDVFTHDPAGNPVESRGEVHFAWVLEGRAIQDVWICRETGMYGSTFRMYEPAVRAWRITWFNPVNSAHEELIGRRSGADIVQVSSTRRWSFTDITASSFRWLGEVLEEDGKTWRLHTKFHARRMQ